MGRNNKTYVKSLCSIEAQSVTILNHNLLNETHSFYVFILFIRFLFQNALLKRH